MRILLERVAAVSKRLSRRQGFALVGVGAAALLGLALGEAPLLDPDEARHAEIAREMLVSGRVLEPLINFEPYHHKPSLLYVLVGVCYRLFGVGETAARLVPALLSWLTIVTVYGYGARTSVAVGLVASSLLAACGFFVHVGRFTNFDALLTATMTAAVVSFATWLDRRERGRMLLAAYLFVGIAVLAKGPAALIMVAGPVLFLIVRGQVSVRELRPFAGAVLTGAVVAAWAVPVWLQAPQYLVDFVWIHNIRRYLWPADIFHPEPFWFFVPIVFGALLPWSLLLPHAFGAALRRKGSDAFLAAYCVWVLLFFSLSTGKLATYVLPAFPAAAVVVARWLVDAAGATATRGRALVSVAAGLCASLPFAAAIAAHLESPGQEAIALVFVPVAVAAATVLVAGRSRMPTTIEPLLVLCAGMIATVLTFELAAPTALGRFTSDRDLATAALEHGRPDRMVAFGVMPYSFLFYTTWEMVHGEDEDAYRAAFDEAGSVLVLTKDGRVPVLRGIIGDVELREIARNRRHVLLLRPAATPLPSGLPSGRP